MKEALKITAIGGDESGDIFAKVAMTLKYLAILHWNQNKYDEALIEYEEALRLEGNAEANPATYLSNVA